MLVPVKPVRTPKYHFKIGKGVRKWNQLLDIELVEESIHCWCVMSCIERELESDNFSLKREGIQFPVQLREIKNGRIVEITYPDGRKQRMLDSGISSMWDWDVGEICRSLKEVEDKIDLLVTKAVAVQEKFILDLKSQKRLLMRKYSREPKSE